MKSVLIFFSFLILWFAAPGVAMSAPGALSLEKICQDLKESPQTEAESPSISLGMWDLFKFVTNPETLIGFRQYGVTPKLTASDSTFIFSLGLSAPLPDDTAEKFENAKWASTKLRRDFDYIKNSYTLAECVEKARFLGLTEASLQENLLLQNEVSDLFHRKVSIAAERTARKGATFYPNAKVIGVSDWPSMIKELARGTQGRKAHLVFLLHADKSGRLYDKSGRIVLNREIQELARYSKTVTIFSCSPEQVAQRYGQDFAFLNQKEVAVFTPVLKGPLRQLQQTPLGLFETFAEIHASNLVR